MKKSTFFLILLLGIRLLHNQTFAQKEGYEMEPKIPASVLKAFQAKFPAAKKTDWSMEGKTEYEAKFSVNGQQMSANFLANGEWKETEWRISRNKLPQSVLNTLKSQFKNYDFDKAEVSDTPEKGKVYEVKLEKEKSAIEIVINENGKVLKREKSGEENELPRSKLSRYHYRNPSLIAASSGVLNSFIPIRFTIGIHSTYIFQFTSFLKYEFHE